VSEHRIVGVFGVSGVGKSTLIAKAREDIPSVHLQASVLIKEGLADPAMHSEALRQLSGDQVRANQDVLVMNFWRKVRAQHCRLILLDGHLVIDIDRDLLEIPRAIICRLRPSLLVHVEDDVDKIVERRMQDNNRVRPIRSEATLREHQQVSSRLCKVYARELGIKAVVLRPDEAERFRRLLRSL
jgi:adenylate kinase